MLKGVILGLFILLMGVTFGPIINLQSINGSNSSQMTCYSFQPSKVWVDDDWAGSDLGEEVEPGKRYGYNAFDKMQDGIDAVANNGIVKVFNGTYYENIFISKPVSLTGSDTSSTTVNGMKNGNVVTIQNVNEGFIIKNFTITNSGLNMSSGVDISFSDYIWIDNCIIISNSIGIFLDKSNLCNITRNIIASNNHTGIMKEENIWSNCYVITDNKISNNGEGIYLRRPNNCSIQNNLISSNENDGIHIMGTNNIIRNNTILNNWNGIYLGVSPGTTVDDNIIESNLDYGIFLDKPFNITITKNNISNNGGGIFIGGAFTGKAIGNMIDHNNFFNNSKNAYMVGPSKKNCWNENFWDDYIGLKFKLFVDPDGDGRGNIPYHIPGWRCNMLINWDFHPLMEPYKS